MRHQERCVRGGFDGEIPVANGVHTVLSHAVEPELIRNEMPIDGMRRACQSAGSEGEDIHAAAALPETIRVSIEHPEIGQKMVGEQHGLGVLCVGVSR